ncbi:MAG: hypothetical protein AAB323_01020 [Pseudomonadota bacterium]
MSTVTTIDLPPIRGEPDNLRRVSLDWNNMPRRWVFMDISGAPTAKSDTRTLSAYAFTHVVFAELLTGQQFLSSSAASDPGPGTGLQKVGSFTLALANIQDNYPALATFNAAFTNGQQIQMILVDEIEGGNHSSEAVGVKGQIFVHMFTNTYVLVRLALTAYCISYRIFKQEANHAMFCAGNLDGSCFDFKSQSSDGSKDPLKTLIHDTNNAIAKGLSGAKAAAAKPAV